MTNGEMISQSDYIKELEEDKEIYEEYISNFRKKSEKWKKSWEVAEKRCGALERNLQSLRELQGLEIDEIMESEKRILEILEDIPLPPGRFTIVNALNEWIEKYTDWHKRMMEHLSDD